MKNIRSIVPLLPAQQWMLTATLKSTPDTYVQQLLFEVNEHTLPEIRQAIDKLVRSYECFRSLILFEGLKQPVWVCGEETKPTLLSHQVTESSIYRLIGKIRAQGFDFQKQPCLRFDWIVTENKKFLCITNHHILYDGWGKQMILRDFIRLLKFPSTFLPEKLNKNWYEAWSKLDHSAALESYKKYILSFDNYAEFTIIESGNSENHELKSEISTNRLNDLSLSMGLTAAEVVNFCWSCFMTVWTQNPRIQYGVVKQNGLLEQVKNGFGIGVQTLPFQFEVDQTKRIKDLLTVFKTRERKVYDKSYVNTLDPMFNSIAYSFLIAFENYPLENSLQSVTDEFRLEFSYDRSEFPLSLAITPYKEHYAFDWHYNTSYHSKEQISYISSAFLDFLNSFDSYLESTVRELSMNLMALPVNPDSIRVDISSFFRTVEENFNETEQAIYSALLLRFQESVSRIWIYGDKHEYTAALICAAWISNVEVLTLNEKETDQFIEHLFEIKQPDVIFSSANDSRFDQAVTMNTLLDFSIPSKSYSNKTDVALSICTSGSTGKPKVVQLSLENMVAFFEAWDHAVPWRQHEVFAVVAHPAFDVGVAELIFPLWKGWTRVLINKADISDLDKLNKVFDKVTAFHMVPALLEGWIASKAPDHLERIIMTGGDKVSQRIERKLHKKFKTALLFQFYGPSESSVLITGFENKGQFNEFQLPLGTRFIHGDVWVINENDLLTPPFQEGELFVIGTAVGLGYAVVESDSKFGNIEGVKTYRTGDLGYRDATNTIFFKGRKDNQIKINGQRIEVSRIESALKEWSGGDRWVVVCKENFLGAFGILENEVLPDREKLFKLLPFYAVPQDITLLDEFPVNKNGKIDRLALERILDERLKTVSVPHLSEELTSIIDTVFPNRQIKYHLGWYSNGFNSVDAMKLAGKIKTKLNRVLPMEMILSARSLAEINFNEDDNPITLISVEPENEVHDAASRLFFLSESDEKFSGSYWIINGFKIISSDNIVKKINAWVQMQTALHLKVASKKNKYIWKEKKIPIHSVFDLQEQEFKNLVQSSKTDIFDALWEVFINSSEASTMVAFRIHHGLLDGLGIQQLFETLFNDLSSGQSTILRFVEPFAEKADIKFWREYLKSSRIHILPFKRIQPSSDKTAHCRFQLNSDERSIINEIKKRNNCGTFEAGLILWSKLWYTYFPEGDFTTGVVVNSRKWLDPLIIEAMSANILPFAIDTDEESRLLESWRILFKKRFDRFSEIAKLDKKQSDGTPFFNTSFVYNSFGAQPKDIHSMDFGLNDSVHDISLDLIENDNQIFFQWEFNSELFSSEAIQNLHNRMLGKVERPFIEVMGNQEISFNEQWLDIVQKFPQKIAVSDGTKTLDYQTFNERIEWYGSKIEYSGTGVLPLKLDRYVDDVALLMVCILKNIPFIPIDSDLPADRIAQIESLCGQKACSKDAFYQLVQVRPNTSFNKELVYCIATSGSTGVPKLVGVRKKGFLGAIQAWREQYVIDSEDRVLQAASFSFDVFIGDIGRSLFNGAALVILDRYERKDPEQILEKLNTERITIFETTPLVVRWWMQDDELLSLDYLRLLIVGSDAWKVGEMQKLKKCLPKSLRLLNSYGLSEATIDNSFYELTEDYYSGIVVPIGKSMKHSILSITNENRIPFPQGKEGLLCIDGPCVGTGYFDGKAWSHSSGSWLTADRGVLDEYGNFHFLGRSDKQVKIRGQRLELQEVESILVTLLPAVDWMVFDFESGFASELAAAFTTFVSEKDLGHIRKEMLNNYPSYFLPSAFFRVNAPKMNHNGKLDVDHLRDELSKNKPVFSEEINSEENFGKIRELILSLFGKDVSLEDNFFSLGLSSFDAMLFVREWNKIHEVSFKVYHLFTSENFEQLSELSQSLTAAENRVENMESRFANKAQESIWVDMQGKDHAIYNLPHFVPLPLNEADLHRDLSEVLKRCASLFSRFTIDDKGRLIQHYLVSDGYMLPTMKKSAIEFEDFKKDSYFANIEIDQGPCFEAAMIEVEGSNYLYFNPHHLVYDGGSDEVLTKLFESVRKGQPIILSTNELSISRENTSWKKYFELSFLPQPIQPISANKTDGGIIWSELSKSQVITLSELQKTWKTSGSIIYTALLGSSLERSEIPINWISLIMDTRDVPEIGMFMRAFPFPINSKKSLSDKVGIAKSALSFLFKHKNETVIYPRHTEYSWFHQVGLIIQHPAMLNDTDSYVPNTFSRPRLPLTLYVEQLNERIFLRWEFMRNFFSEEKVTELQFNFKEGLDNFIQKKIRPTTFEILEEVEIEEMISSQLQSHPWVGTWKKYTGNKMNDHFFKSGGSSLQALLMLNEINIDFEVKLSLAEFFKVPTFTALVEKNNHFLKKDELIWIIQDGIESEEWFLPPIFGLALIYNNYPLNSKMKAVAFNYPMAIDSLKNYESIEELAKILVDSYLETYPGLSEITKITAYSMGGIVAFEVIKVLESIGVEVGSLVIWDKPAQIEEPSNDLFEEEIVQKELINYVDSISYDNRHRSSMLGILKHHQKIINKYHQKHFINSNITVIYCENGFLEKEIFDWSKLTKGDCKFKALKNIDHYSIPRKWTELNC